MKIVIPVLGMGRSGGERVLSKLATELVKLGNEVFFITPESDDGPYYPTDANILYCKRSTHSIKMIRLFMTLLHLWFECRKLKADIVLANYHLTAYIAVMLLTKKQRFYYVQAYEVNFSGSILRKFVAYVTYFLPLNKIVNSESLLPKHFNDYVAVVPAGIDYDLFYDAELPNIENIINVGLVGRLEPYKGTKEVLYTLSQYIRDNKLEDKVQVNIAVYLPNINFNIKNINHYTIGSDEELADFYKKNDIFIATGLIEDGAFHYPCAEAMTAGCLVISNYAPLANTSSVLKMGTFSEYQLILALDKCLENQSNVSLWVRENQHAMKDFEWSNIGAKFFECIRT